jgi:hypothetical protein
MNSQGNTQQKKQCWSNAGAMLEVSQYLTSNILFLLQSNCNKNRMVLAQKQT